jgi:hypothetical protein
VCNAKVPPTKIRRCEPTRGGPCLPLLRLWAASSGGRGIPRLLLRIRQRRCVSFAKSGPVPWPSPDTHSPLPPFARSGRNLSRNSRRGVRRFVRRAGKTADADADVFREKNTVILLKPVRRLMSSSEQAGTVHSARVLAVVGRANGGRIFA